MTDDRNVPTRRIVCAIDLSPASREVVRTAAELAREMHASLAIVHASTAPLYEHAPPIQLPLDVPLESIEGDADELDGYVAEARRLGASVASAETVTGVPWEQIVAAARAEPTWLVVLGSHGRTGLARALLGSVAEHVVRHAPCSVLVGRDPEPGR